jgi:hypothetical protein
MPRGGNGIIFDFDSVWITGTMSNELYRGGPQDQQVSFWVDDRNSCLVPYQPRSFVPIFSPREAEQWVDA